VSGIRSPFDRNEAYSATDYRISSRSDPFGIQEEFFPDSRCITSGCRLRFFRSDREETPVKPRATTANRVLALLAVLALALAACGGGDSGDGTAADGTSSETSGGGGGDSPLAERFPDGVVRIGIANEVPYGYEGEDGEPTGEAPELAKAILA